ncbi:uncharacterized protein LOC123322328 [Coccinella septempunctata]|uniref:uncharacterized protein LOC123322328 n=1 Tax=Coccinella septempunctata TaxID=41139 RepID=UPI001D08C863|nr:uncharacterized protein LOC123322328 [Coccinella septempunctata]
MEFIHLFDSSSSSSSSSSNSDEEFLAELTENIVPNLLIPEILLDRPKNEGNVEETVPLYSNKQFTEHFRVSRDIVHKLKEQFEASKYYPKKETGFRRIGSERCILAFLWFASNESTSFRDVADRFNLSVSTLHRIVVNVTSFLSDMSGNVIVRPSVTECRIISEEFAEMGFVLKFYFIA